MCRIASLSLLQRLKRSMSGDARDFNNIETRAVIETFFFLQGKAPKEIHAILTATLGETCKFLCHHRTALNTASMVVLTLSHTYAFFCCCCC